MVCVCNYGERGWPGSWFLPWHWSFRPSAGPQYGLVYILHSLYFSVIRFYGTPALARWSHSQGGEPIPRGGASRHLLGCLRLSLHWQVPRGPNLFSSQPSEAWICWCNLVKSVRKNHPLPKKPLSTCTAQCSYSFMPSLRFSSPQQSNFPSS